MPAFSWHHRGQKVLLEDMIPLKPTCGRSPRNLSRRGAPGRSAAISIISWMIGPVKHRAISDRFFKMKRTENPSA
jgi:hypothetical protein